MTETRLPRIPGAMILVFLCAVTPARAHHSVLAEFDPEKTVELTGIVTKVEWTNPHTYIYLEVATRAGATERWAWELASPNGLERQGWTPGTVRVGDRITANGTPARDGSRKANTRSILLGDGQFISAALDSLNHPQDSPGIDLRTN